VLFQRKGCTFAQEKQNWPPRKRGGPEGGILEKKRLPEKGKQRKNIERKGELILLPGADREKH